MGKLKRFQIVQEETVALLFSCVILVDTVTGVLYLQTSYGGAAGGLTPLLDTNGKPMVWDVDRAEAVAP